MRTRLSMALLLLVLGVLTWALAGCGGSGEDGAASADNGGETGDTTQVTISPEEDPIRIVFNGELSGDLVYDSALVRKGIRTALQTLGNELAGWPIEYTEIDNQSDPLLAVEKTRALVETDRDGDKISDPVDYIVGPLSSSGAAGVTFFLAQRESKREQIPQCSVTAQPSENITTSAKLGFIPQGIYSSHGYYLGKFASEVLRCQTANCIHYDDRIAEELQSGFERGFAEGGGSVSSVTYVPVDTTDFSTYLSALEPADCTMFWIRGEGAIPFVQQYAATGLTGTLLVPMSSNYSESQLAYLNALGLGRGIIACDCYAPMLDNTKNQEFIAAYQGLYPGEYPTPEVYGGWEAVMLYAQAVEQVAAQRATEDREGTVDEEDRVDPRDPADVVAAMAKLTLDTPSGVVNMTGYASRTYLATRDFYILRSKEVGGGRVAWTPIQTYPQVLLGR